MSAAPAADYPGLRNAGGQALRGPVEFIVIQAVSHASFTRVRRFVVIDRCLIVRIQRTIESTDFSHTRPEVTSSTWGHCRIEEPDRFLECGELADALASAQQCEGALSASATASRSLFAEMVSAAYDLGNVLYVGSRGMWAIADRELENKRELANIHVDEDLIRFNFQVSASLEDWQQPRERAPGIHMAEFSLRALRLVRTDPITLFEPDSGA